jgi:Ca2+/H+ antiporter
MISVLALMFVLYDGEINSFESIFLLILYAVYILIMYYNDKIEAYTKSIGIE